jgi:Holliday junction resolvase YEN1
VLAAEVNTQWAGAGLYIFFKMLTEHIKAPVSLIFVLDGAARPPFKRGHAVRRQPIWMMELAIELVKIFGYQIHHVSLPYSPVIQWLKCTVKAPGEAEAELASLNRKGYIHGVISSDSDAVLFGTPLLFRRLFNLHSPSESSHSSSSVAFQRMSEVIRTSMLCIQKRQ